MTKVAAIKVNSYDYNYEDVARGIKEALDLLGGLDKFTSSGDRVLLKPNWVDGVDQGEGATIHP